MNDLENNFCFIPESCERNFRRNFDILYLGSPPIYFLFKNILNQNWQTEQTEFPQISNIKNRSNQTSTYLQNTSMSTPPCSLEDTRDIYDTVCGLIELSGCLTVIWSYDVTQGCLELLTASPTISLLLTILPLITGAVLVSSYPLFLTNPT